MSPGTLKIALAASVALNLFAIAAGATLFVTRAQIEDRVEAQHRPARAGSPMRLIDQLDPAVRERVRDTLRASALAARPDFEEARLKRRQAVEMGRSATFDTARAAALLEQSRTAELRGRARLEADAVALLATLEPDDRRALSEILTRRGRAAGRDRGGRPQHQQPTP
ncbi:MAG: periplasmic heavy metal sensor [Alphaproteobacteria bacterium]|nr:periplasmic heavy metal sensor [Alphaproteobacteria bacterium]MBU4040724.1 periplasmic heavy metal sensor [Alphaproteobacteria bacterium]MBU4135837.1 periplasmic heavy metal sensor [Alphaproteobacteria bacterium]